MASPREQRAPRPRGPPPAAAARPGRRPGPLCAEPRRGAAGGGCAAGPGPAPERPGHCWDERTAPPPPDPAGRSNPAGAPGALSARGGGGVAARAPGALALGPPGRCPPAPSFYFWPPPPPPPPAALPAAAAFHLSARLPGREGAVAAGGGGDAGGGGGGGQEAAPASGPPGSRPRGGGGSGGGRRRLFLSAALQGLLRPARAGPRPPPPRLPLGPAARRAGSPGFPGAAGGGPGPGPGGRTPPRPGGAGCALAAAAPLLLGPDMEDGPSAHASCFRRLTECFLSPTRGRWSREAGACGAGALGGSGRRARGRRAPPRDRFRRLGESRDPRAAETRFLPLGVRPRSPLAGWGRPARPGAAQAGGASIPPGFGPERPAGGGDWPARAPSAGGRAPPRVHFLRRAGWWREDNGRPAGGRRRHRCGPAAPPPAPARRPWPCPCPGGGARVWAGSRGGRGSGDLREEPGARIAGRVRGEAARGRARLAGPGLAWAGPATPRRPDGARLLVALSAGLGAAGHRVRAQPLSAPAGPASAAPRGRLSSRWRLRLPAPRARAGPSTRWNLSDPRSGALWGAALGSRVSCAVQRPPGPPPARLGPKDLVAQRPWREGVPEPLAGGPASSRESAGHTLPAQDRVPGPRAQRLFSPLQSAPGCLPLQTLQGTALRGSGPALAGCWVDVLTGRLRSPLRRGPLSSDVRPPSRAGLGRPFLQHL
ncbi:hypothetical protein J0S82_011701 [Galemys pyrenaicus]|uniref:Uncharacterized protein n=1 Tax=Galemys pyrenaicus TaxID=202257 RepID=A0A8J5ZTP6_GALPY|nr:hypothetical protein J0S82_011701 [Galemys pyrenaicus]